MSAIVILDVETTGLSVEYDDIWEIAAVRREVDGTETEFHAFVEHDPGRCRDLPADTFRADHDARYPLDCRGRKHVGPGVLSKREARDALWSFIGTDRPTLVGAVPSFDTERLHHMSWRLDGSSVPRDPWHYHLCDVETLVAGYLAAILSAQWLPEAQQIRIMDALALPYDSNALSRAVDVDPDHFARHTAMGDVRWAAALYDAVMGGAR